MGAFKSMSDTERGTHIISIQILEKTPPHFQWIKVLHSSVKIAICQLLCYVDDFKMVYRVKIVNT